MPRGYGPRRGGAAYRQHGTFKQHVLDRDHHTCQLCGCKLGQVCNLHYAPVSQLDVAHIIPWADSHDSSLDNVRVLCHPCNVRERYRTQAQPIFS